MNGGVTMSHEEAQDAAVGQGVARAEFNDVRIVGAQTTILCADCCEEAFEATKKSESKPAP
jgi:hypothetical protein